MVDSAVAQGWLADGASVAVLTGAGISAESGVPTFRGAGGLWRSFRPEELATPEAFRRDARLVWEWYEWRRGVIAMAQPNAAHHALVALESAKPNFTLVTQNVDGLHERAGSSKILRLHGDIWHLRCTVCAESWVDRQVPLPELPPRCACGAMARPGVVWFGELLPDGVMEEAIEAVSAADVLLVIGTSAVVYPAAGLIPVAKRAGAKVVEINPEPAVNSSWVDCALAGCASDWVPRLCAAEAGR